GRYRNLLWRHRYLARHQQKQRHVGVGDLLRECGHSAILVWGGLIHHFSATSSPRLRAGWRALAEYSMSRARRQCVLPDYPHARGTFQPLVTRNGSQLVLSLE